MDIKVSKHGIERYITRVLEVEVKDKEEMEDMVVDLGGYITMTIRDMIKNNDLSHTVYRNTNKLVEQTYVLYRNVCILVNNYRDNGLLVSTVFKINNDYKNNIEDDIELINFAKNQILKLKNEIIPYEFNNSKNGYKDNINKRIIQYIELLFQNPVKIGGCSINE